MYIWYISIPLVLTTSSVDTENMAAIEIQQNLLKVNTFLEFMADLGTKKANKVRKEDTVIGFTSGGYIHQAWNFAGLTCMEKWNFSLQYTLEIRIAHDWEEIKFHKGKNW